MLLCKNVIINGQRTSMRLDRVVWQSLSDICIKEDISLNDLISKIDSLKGTSSLAGVTRLFVLAYFVSKLGQYESVNFDHLEPYHPEKLFAKDATASAQENE